MQGHWLALVVLVGLVGGCIGDNEADGDADADVGTTAGAPVAPGETVEEELANEAVTLGPVPLAEISVPFEIAVDGTLVSFLVDLNPAVEVGVSVTGPGDCEEPTGGGLLIAAVDVTVEGDCGALEPGSYAIRITHIAGVAAGTVVVTGQVPVA